MNEPQRHQEQPRAAHIQVELDLRLLKAAAAGDLERLQAAHSEGGDLAAVGLNGGLPLHFAAKGGHTAVCSYLLSHGAEVDATTAHEAGGFTALWIAAQYGREDVIADLVKADAAVDHQAVDGSTALWIAAAKENDTAVHTLLTVCRIA
jgi:ankyrin repeat protein